MFEEINYLEAHGISAREHLKIARNAHIITAFHKDEDGKDTEIGTTRTGNGPAYRDKYNRSGVRAGDIPELEPFLVDIYQELSGDTVILMEGAQGFWLDPDWGDYPYVTSSHTGTAAAIQNGINPRSIRNVWGVIKAYETYVEREASSQATPFLIKFSTPGQSSAQPLAEFDSVTGLVCDILSRRLI